MKTKLLLIFLCYFAFTFSISAQTKQPRILAESFYEYTCDEVITQLMYFYDALFIEPKSRGYVIVYEGQHQNYLGQKKGYRYSLPQKGGIDSLIKTMKRRWEFLGHNPEDIVFINGGFRKIHQVQFWIVPINSTAPRPLPTLKRMKYRKGKPQDICEDF